jgi:mycothiol S-conjugate amidase
MVPDDAPLCLLSVHAHPDDEASKGAATVARYAAEGVNCVLVCCTGGEEGDIHNPAMERPEVRERLAEVRAEELATSVGIIGYDEVELLGYRDSGMPESPANSHPDAFWAAPLHESVGRLVALIRRHRPQVIVTYNDEQSGYPHPDHLRVHDISVAAFDLAGDPNAYPDAGEPWTPSKLYYTVWSMARMKALHEKFGELGLESPFGEEWFDRPNHDDRITTSIPIGEYWQVRRDALLAHATQIDPNSPFWFGLPDDVTRTIHPYDDYIRAQSRVPTDLPEHDLFAGLRPAG